MLSNTEHVNREEILQHKGQKPDLSGPARFGPGLQLSVVGPGFTRVALLFVLNKVFGKPHDAIRRDPITLFAGAILCARRRRAQTRFELLLS